MVVTSFHAGKHTDIARQQYEKYWGLHTTEIPTDPSQVSATVFQSIVNPFKPSRNTVTPKQHITTTASYENPTIDVINKGHGTGNQIKLLFFMPPRLRAAILVFDHNFCGAMLIASWHYGRAASHT